MHPIRLESASLIAWVTPLAGGLLDLSRRDTPAPVAMLRRSPPEPDRPAWLALRARLAPPFESAESARWRLLDRTPLSARLGYDPGDGSACTIRYELTPDAMLVELAADPTGRTGLAGAVLINGVRDSTVIEPLRGFGRVMLHDRRDATCPIRVDQGEPGDPGSCALMLRFSG